MIDVGHRRPDILLYPTEGKCIIIEFKAPDVDVSEHLDQINKYAMVINNLSNDNFKIHSFYGYIVGENIEYDFIEERNSSFKQSPNLKFIFRPSYDIPGKFGREKGDLYTEIIKYSDILKRAQLRNRILMEKLEENNTNELQYWDNAHNSGTARDFCTQSKYCIKWQTDFAFFPVIIHENS